jgi:hypothetical protein
MTINQEFVKIILFQVGARKFRSTTQNQVVIGYKLFLFQHQVILMLRSTECNGLIRHLKDRGKDDFELKGKFYYPCQGD